MSGRRTPRPSDRTAAPSAPASGIANARPGRRAGLARPARLGLLALAALAAPVGPLSAQEMADVEIRTVPVRGSVYMIQGRGGNIGLTVGADGAVMIDDQFAPLTERILAAVRELGADEVRFVINTHWHGDHTGGNENMGEAGALVVAHGNVRRRMSVDQVLSRFGRVDTVAAASDAALPVVTFDQSVAFHLNDDEVRALHVPRAHTDGDAIIHFVGDDVVHMGDTYFNGMYPFIDLSSGGGIDGMLDATGQALALMGPETLVIPGHGPLSDRDGLRRYRDMLRTIRDRVWEAKRDGRTLEEAQGKGLTEEWDAEWGGQFISADALVASIYLSLPPV